MIHESACPKSPAPLKSNKNLQVCTADGCKMEDMMKKVVKCGGSTLASARQFKKVGDIIRSDKSRRYVVPSAPGKRNDKDE